MIYILSMQQVQPIQAQAKPPVKYIDKLHVPFGLVAYYDLAEGMAAAKALNKPVMLDFTGHSCPNCRKMEEQVWKEPRGVEKDQRRFCIGKSVC